VSSGGSRPYVYADDKVTVRESEAVEHDARPEHRSEPAEHAPVERVDSLADHRR
jgi:hypothetical protein